MSQPIKAAVVQAASLPTDAGGSAEKAAELIRKASGEGASLIVFPEAFIGGYPKGASFGTPVGQRRPEGREDFRRYHAGAIDLDGEEVQILNEATAETGAFVVIGVIERDGATVYCTALFFDGEKGLIAKHRKLMPTGAERLIWGFGDGSTMPVIDTPFGRIGAVICWENYMPMLRMAMYDQGITIYCAPTADDRDGWAATMQHIALEGRCFVLSACQHITRGAYPQDYDCAMGDDPELVLMRGGSMIVAPLGEVLAGPDYSGENILYATLDPAEVVRGKYDFDVAGHYARPDIFQLSVDVSEHRAVTREGEY
ncbi:carbon-nitrogen hydrolase family protein [Altericroceibacterium endophyticum]|uniref:Nitrilase n=1 Tax=Altericroceibacterium endophyticum TaxID=1808508 RepID=A0A6I4T9S4_9SPHN|nr:carbon-nitrogen hydrolase family protein [Altericroceibacterium endophyticum]MXO67042.1 nitrilase [Altericroceibacterium endophyticum]